MNNTGGEGYARARISDYMRRMRGETTGPWVLPEPPKPKPLNLSSKLVDRHSRVPTKLEHSSLPKENGEENAGGKPTEPSQQAFQFSEAPLNENTTTKDTESPPSTPDDDKFGNNQEAKH